MRKDARETAFKILYSSLYNDGETTPLFNETAKEAKLNDEEKEYALEIIAAVNGNKKEIDAIIERLAEKAKYSLDRIYPTDLCALYVGIAEMTYTEVPAIVAINEAVNLCSKYSEKESASFVNGILAAYKTEKETVSEQ